MYVANFLMEEGSNWENEKGDDYLLLLFIYEIIQNFRRTAVEIAAAEAETGTRFRSTGEIMGMEAGEEGKNDGSPDPTSRPGSPRRRWT